ncbi:MAG: hypothetical protein QM569_09775 [Acidovorax sp.]|uniref:hypothetical protein n=1 Tax=Acidovorax sp. TaxID=1872122 RepID=UPI0039E37664
MRAFLFLTLAVFPKSPYIRHYIGQKEKKPATVLIASFPLLTWCRRDESNTRPSHYEWEVIALFCLLLVAMMPLLAQFWHSQWQSRFSMAAINKRGPYQWRAQIRKHGFPL